MNRLLLLLLALGGVFGPSRLPGQNLITNGNFDGGDTGFTSDYTFIYDYTSTTPGTFGIRITSIDFNSGYTTFTDHTGDHNGLMMLVDGSPTAGAIVWQETVPVSAGAAYTFSAWATSADPANPPPLRFFINGTQVGSDLALNTNSGVWQNFTAVWNAGSSTSATLSIVDLSTISTEADGNDFALDDLSFTFASGAVQFASTSVSATENEGSISLTVQRVGGSAGAIAVDYATSDGTAVAGTDYTAASGTLSWADGDMADKTITVPLTDRSIYDGSTKTFTATLANATDGAALGTPVSTSVNILDNDSAPQPTVAIASPVNGATFVVGASVPFAASVTDPGGLLRVVTFNVNGNEVYQSTGSGPFVTNVDTTPFPPGDYVVAAAAIDNQGRTNTSTVTVHLVAATTGIAPPTSSVLTPLLDPNGQPRSLPAGVTITVAFTAASADGSALQTVSLYADGVLVAAFDGSGNPVTGAASRPVRRDASATPGLDAIFQTPYTLPGTDKLINMIAVALDTLGHSTVSNVATIHSTVTTDNAPLLTLSGLASGTHVKVNSVNPVSVSASDPDAAVRTMLAGPGRQDAASDAVLAKLEYYINGVFDHATTAPPFDFNFSPPSSGKFVLEAVATDGSGLATISDPITVDVDAPPTVSIAASAAVTVEGGAKGVVVLTRTGDTSAALTVRYKVAGSALAGVDYKVPGGTVMIPAGVSKVKVKLKTLANAVDGTRVAKVKLLPAVDGSYRLGTATVGKIKVTDND